MQLQPRPPEQPAQQEQLPQPPQPLGPPVPPQYPPRSPLYPQFQPSQKPRSRTVLGIILGIIAFVVAATVVGAIFQAVSNNAAKDTTNLTTATSWRTYTSTQYGFSQSFPGNPTASNSSLNIQGVNVPTTTYERDNGGSYFATEVVSYPTDFDMSDVDARLEGALNGSVENTQGAKLTSSSFTQLAGYRAITGVITVTQGNLTLQEYETAFLKGNTMYLFIGSAASASDFDTFTSSFKFN